MRVLGALAFIVGAWQVSAITITSQTAKANQNGDIIQGILSHGYLYAPKGTTFTQQPNSKIVLGDMSSFLMTSPATCDMDSGSKIEVGSYSLNTLDKGCKFSLSLNAQITKLVSSQDGRSELYCNSTFGLGSESYLTLQPQSLVYVSAPFTIGTSIFTNLKQGSVLQIEHTTVIQDHAVVNLETQARFNVLKSATGVVQITSSHGTPIKPTTVHLFESSKIINEGAMTIGGGKATKVQLMKSGLLKIGPKGSFAIASSTFDIGPSSFWIINGTFSFDEGSSLQSGLQSNITVGQTGIQEAGTFKTLTGGNVTVGAGGSLHLTGTAQITGTLSLAASSHIDISGRLSMSSKTTSFVLNYASTASIEGKFTISSGFVHVGSFGGIDVGQQASLTMYSTLIMGERSYISFAFSAHCVDFKPIVIPPYTSHVITNKNQAQTLGFLCG